MKIRIDLNTLLGMTDLSVLPKKHGFSLDKIGQTDRQTIRFILKFSNIFIYKFKTHSYAWKSISNQEFIIYLPKLSSMYFVFYVQF